MHLVLDTWPLVTIIAGLFSELASTGTARRLQKLCVTSGIDFSGERVRSLVRYLSMWTVISTTGCVMAEAFYLLREAAADDFGNLLCWTAERFPEPRLVPLAWSSLVASPVAAKLGVTDASVLAAVSVASLEDEKAMLLHQDGRLHTWCVRHDIPATTCLEVVSWKV
jgi:hypothetical protein